MIDPFGRTIRYLRLSVTDRCDLRCIYGMPERMAFRPRATRPCNLVAIIARLEE